MDQEKIGKFIAKLRKEKNMTQVELGKKLGVTKNAVSKWERGLCLMDMSLLKPLCEILDISIVELLNGERRSINDDFEKTEKVVIKTIDYSINKIKKEKRSKKIMAAILIPLALLSIVFIDTIYAVISKTSPIISVRKADENDIDSYVDKGLLINVYYCVEGKYGDVMTVIPTFKNTNYNCPNK